MEPAARRLFRLVEPIHLVTYLAPEPNNALMALGHRNYWDGYFAGRAAPLGRAPAEVVHAIFYNFADGEVARHIPHVWDIATPEAVLAARERGCAAAVRRILADLADSPGVTRAADLATKAATSAPTEGRAMYAGLRTLPIPDEPVARLWHSANLLREHRGDGHIAALMLAGLSGPEAVVSYAATGLSLPEDLLRSTRGYTEDEWAATKQQLRDKGLFTADGTFTEAGQAQRDAIEAQTDAAAVAPYDRLGTEKTERLTELVRPWARSITKQIFG